MLFNPRLVVQWHNAFHLLELVLGVVCAAIVAPQVAADDFLTNTEVIFTTLACLVAFQVGVLVAYFAVNADLGKMVNIDKEQHFYLRCVISGVVGALYICEGSFLLDVAAPAEDDDDLLPLELASGVVALVTGVVHLIESVASWRSVTRFDAVEASAWRFGNPLHCACCEREAAATPTIVIADHNVGETSS